MEEIIKNSENNESRLGGGFMPKEEKLIFERAINRLPHPSISSNLSYKELAQYTKIYLEKHNYYHQKIQETPLAIAEVKISLRTLLDLLEEYEVNKITESYFHLALLAVEENPGSVYVVSEKVLLGEFVERGGLEPSVWNWKPKIEFFPELVKCLHEKAEKNNITHFVERYQSLRIQELLPPLLL